METLPALQKVTAGIDVHRMLLVVTVLIEHEDDTVGKEQRQFGGFKRDKRASGTSCSTAGDGPIICNCCGLLQRQRNPLQPRIRRFCRFRLLARNQTQIISPP